MSFVRVRRSGAVAFCVDQAMCRENGLAVVDFDGSADAMFARRDLEGRPHIDYVPDAGIPELCFAGVDPEKLWQSLLAAHGGRDIDLGDYGTAMS